MALMPGLQINIGQHLKLTPQLQQSIKILQYSALEVQQTIETTLETNYMLELVDELDEDIDTTQRDSEDEPAAQESQELESIDEKPVDINQNDKITSELTEDYEWQEVYGDHSPSSVAPTSANNDDYTSPENYTSAEKTLHDHLHWQADIYSWPDYDELIASYLIDDISDEGYLKSTLEDLYAYISSNEPDIEIALNDMERVLSVVQQFEPTGVAARSVPECLLLQLAAQKQTPYVVTATQLITENFDWLRFHDEKRIKKVYGLDDAQLTHLFRLIQSLNPRPGREFSVTQSEIIIPDLRIRRRPQGWLVELNVDAFPHLTVNSAYVDMAANIQDAEQSKKIKEQLLEAKGLIKSIQSRGETLLKVGKYIVEKQKRFFEEGEMAMQPLVLREVADHLELHESTISRATNQKYMQTPRGTFELKYFFSTGVSQYGSDDQSAIAIKAHIKQLVDAEDPKKPLSDNKLMTLLEEKDIVVARRTIAKYREALKIASSSERRKQYKYKR